MKKLGLILSLSLGLVACDKLNKADRALDDVHHLSEETRDLKEEIRKTNDGVRKQTMNTCMGEINSEYATNRIFPVPTGVMICAQAFAEALTAKEAIEYTFLILKQIDEVTPLKSFGADGSEIEHSLEVQNKILRENYRDLQSLLAIAGFLPEKIVNEVIDREKSGGAYRPTMLKMLMMRAMFIRQTMVEDRYLKTGQFETIGQAKEAIAEMRKVESILRLPFRDELFLKTTGLQTPEGYNGAVANADIVMDADILGFMTSGWSTIATLAKDNMPVTMHANSFDTSTNQAEYQSQLTEQQEVIATAEAFAKAWETNP